MKKYQLNRWNNTIITRNGKTQEIQIFPYRKGTKLLYKIRKRDYHCHNKRTNDTAACTHSELIRTNFDVANEGIDLPEKDTEIKETRQDKYYVREKDAEADKILFYNHRTEDFKLVEKPDYEEVMGELDHTQTPTQLEVDRMSGIESKNPAYIKHKL